MATEMKRAHVAGALKDDVVQPRTLTALRMRAQPQITIVSLVAESAQIEFPPPSVDLKPNVLSFIWDYFIFAIPIVD